MTYERVLGGGTAMAVVHGSLRNSITRRPSVASRRRGVTAVSRSIA